MRCDALRRGAMRRSRARVRGAGDARDRSRFFGVLHRGRAVGSARRGAARCAMRARGRVGCVARELFHAILVHARGVRAVRAHVGACVMTETLTDAIVVSRWHRW